MCFYDKFGAELGAFEGCGFEGSAPVVGVSHLVLSGLSCAWRSAWTGWIHSLYSSWPDVACWLLCVRQFRLPFIAVTNSEFAEPSSIEGKNRPAPNADDLCGVQFSK